MGEKPKPEDVDIMYSHIYEHEDAKSPNAIAPPVTDLAEDNGDTDSDAEKKALKEAMYGNDSMYSDTSDGKDSSQDAYAKNLASGTEANVAAGADKDADSEEE